jgi:hypothetical protein
LAREHFFSMIDDRDDASRERSRHDTHDAFGPPAEVPLTGRYWMATR